MGCPAHLEAAENFEEATGSPAKSKCLPGRMSQCFPIGAKSRRTVCPEVRRERQGNARLLLRAGLGVFPRNSAFMRLQERLSESKRQGEDAGARQGSNPGEAEKK